MSLRNLVTKAKNKSKQMYNTAKDRMLFIAFAAIGLFSATTPKPVAADWAGNGSITSPSDIPAAMTSIGTWVVSSSQNILTQWPYSLITVIIIFVVVIGIGIMLLMKIKGAAGKK